MTYAIELSHLCKSYRDKRLRRFQAVQDVSLTVNPGEAFGFVGPNGAGKSSTIRVIMGLAHADSGTARLFDTPIDDYRSRQGVGYVPENLYLYDYLSPLEFLMTGARLHGLPKTGLEQHCLRWLERFGVAHVAHKRIRAFSKGMTQRTALAHALACRPKLLVLDEPLSGLDPVGRKDVVDILQEYRDQGGAVFFSSHILHDVERLGDRFGIIHQGKLRTISTPDELAGNASPRMNVLVAGPQAPAGFIADGPGKWRIEVPKEDVWSVLDAARNTGVDVVEVRPVKLSLEQAFMRFIEQSQ